MSLSYFSETQYVRIHTELEQKKYRFIFVLDCSGSMCGVPRQVMHKYRFISDGNYKKDGINFSTGRFDITPEENEEMQKEIPVRIAYDSYIYAMQTLSADYAAYLENSSIIGFACRSYVWDNVPALSTMQSVMGHGTDFESMTATLSNHISKSDLPCFVILLTDGCSSISNTTLQRLKKNLRSTDSKLHVIGFTQHINYDLLKKYYEGFGGFYQINERHHIKPTIDAILNDFDKFQKSVDIKINDTFYTIKLNDGKAVFYFPEKPIVKAELDNKPLELLKEEYTQAVYEEIMDLLWETKVENALSNPNQVVIEHIPEPVIEIRDVTKSDVEQIMTVLDQGENIMKITPENAASVYRASEKLGTVTISKAIIDKCDKHQILLDVKSDKLRRYILRKYSEQNPDFVDNLEKGLGSVDMNKYQQSMDQQRQDYVEAKQTERFVDTIDNPLKRIGLLKEIEEFWQKKEASLHEVVAEEDIKEVVIEEAIKEVTNVYEEVVVEEAIKEATNVYEEVVIEDAIKIAHETIDDPTEIVADTTEIVEETVSDAIIVAEYRTDAVEARIDTVENPIDAVVETKDDIQNTIVEENIPEIPINPPAEIISVRDEIKSLGISISEKKKQIFGSNIEIKKTEVSEKGNVRELLKMFK